MRLAVICIGCAALAFGAWWVWSSPDLMAWVIDKQRAFQTRMADGIFALKTGAPGAWGTLLGAAATYGFVHALGPGHGKYLIGGVGLGSSVTAYRLVGLALASSLAQALWAIVLVYGGFFLVEASASQMTALAEDVLAPASYIAIACVGLMIAWRGIRAMRRASHRHEHAHGHEHDDCDCHAHGPTPEQVAQVTTFREVLVLVSSIAIRPCTGAIFLLVIAWQMDIKLAGAAAVAVMGVGTAALTSLVAVSSTAARQVSFVTSSSLNSAHIAIPALQMFAGAAIVLFSLSLLGLTRLG